MASYKKNALYNADQCANTPTTEQLEYAAKRLREAGLMNDGVVTQPMTTDFWKDMEAAMGNTQRLGIAVRALDCRLPVLTRPQP